MQLPDVQYVSLGMREGPTPCDVMVVVAVRWKDKQGRKGTVHGRDEEQALGSVCAFGVWLLAV